MNRKFLEDLLTCIEEDTTKKDIIDKIMTKNGEQIESHKTEVATLKNDIKVKDGVIDNLNTKIKEIENIDVEAIKKEQFDLGKAEGSKEVETFKKTMAVDEILKKSNAKDVEVLKNLLNNDKINYEVKDGAYEISGLDEQINELKETYSYLFETENKGTNIELGGTHEGTPNSDDLSHERKILGLE